MAVENGLTWALLCLHVDDGLLFGDPADPRFLKLKDTINGLFNIKEWKKIPFTFLAVDLEHGEKPGLWDSMVKYVKNMKVPTMEPKAPDAKLEGRDLTAYRQLVMRLRWPAYQAMPHMLYTTSYLAGRASQAVYADFVDACKVHRTMLQEAEAGRARLYYPPMKGEPYILSYFDASLGKEDGGRSQLGSLHFLTSKEAITGPQLAAPVDYHTGRSTRLSGRPWLRRATP